VRAYHFDENLRFLTFGHIFSNKSSGWNYFLSSAGHLDELQYVYQANDSTSYGQRIVYTKDGKINSDSSFFVNTFSDQNNLTMELHYHDSISELSLALINEDGVIVHRYRNIQSVFTLERKILEDYSATHGMFEVKVNKSTVIGKDGYVLIPFDLWRNVRHH
jgi:hypothetical protein